MSAMRTNANKGIRLILIRLILLGMLNLNSISLKDYNCLNSFLKNNNSRAHMQKYLNCLKCDWTDGQLPDASTEIFVPNASGIFCKHCACDYEKSQFS